MSHTQSTDTLTHIDRTRLVVQSMGREELLTELTVLITPNFRRYGNCAQTAFASLNSVFHLVEDATPIIETMVCYPGIVGRGETCGGVTGCLAALGLVFGNQCFPVGMDFIKRFEVANCSTLCSDILEAGMGRVYKFPEDFQAYRDDGAFRICLPAVTKAVHIAGEIIYNALA